MKNGRIPYSVIEHLTGSKRITLGSKPLYRVFNHTYMVRFEIFLENRFVIWAVLEKVSDKPILEKTHKYRVYKRKSTLYRTRMVQI